MNKSENVKDSATPLYHKKVKKLQQLMSHLSLKIISG
jgi:hypothetical protein